MKYLLGILVIWLVGCGYIATEDPGVHQSLQTFENAIKTKDANVAWDKLTPHAQGKLDEVTFRALISSGATFEDLPQLFRNADITTRNIRSDIKAEQPIALPDAKGLVQTVRVVFVQQPDGTWSVGNILEY